MKESYESGSATHIGPESCGAAREGGVEALTGERAGRVFSRVRQALRDAEATKHDMPGCRNLGCPAQYAQR
jgi:hypothetical protein